MGLWFCNSAYVSAYRITLFPAAHIEGDNQQLLQERNRHPDLEVMGVSSLWEIVGPAARPVKLEALSRKRLAVDASIWIYQFLKAVRDKEGNAFKLSHIVGFFRRICKLLYYGILPLFVFDGGAPALKKRVIQQRRERRLENQQDEAMTAQKLLAMQLQNKVTTKAPKRKDASKSKAKTDGDMVYLEDMPILHPEHGSPLSHAQLIPSNESSPNKKFVKKDEYHLPELRQFTISKNDNRIMPASEFQELAENADLNMVDGIDIDSVDPASKEFAELPLATQYMMLSHLRLRSRLRLGYTKDQLEGLFPDSKDFSRFQIEQVKKRNFYTQRLMNVSGMAEDSGNITRRIAGDKDRHYALVKNDDGWTLSLGDGDSELVELNEDGEPVSSLLSSLGDDLKGRERSNQSDQETAQNENSSDSDEEFEDVVSKDDEEDLETNRAIIESIYEMHRHDYDNGKLDLKRLSPKQLKEAVEQSKKLYFELEREERQLEKQLKHTSNKSENSKYQFNESILFGNVPKETQKPEVRDVDEVVRIEEPEEEEEQPSSNTQAAPMPSWFDRRVSQIDKPHVGDAFLQDREEKRRESRDEEAGLISYSEARDLIERRGSLAEAEQDYTGSIRENETKEEDDDVVELEAPHDNLNLKEEEDDDVVILEAPDNRKEEKKEVNLKRRRSQMSPLEGASVASDLTEKNGNGNRDENGGEGGIDDVGKVEERYQVEDNLQGEFDGGAENLESADDVKETVEDNQKKTVEEDQKQPTGMDSNGKKSEQNHRVESSILDYEIDEEDEENLMKQLREEEDQHDEFTHEIKNKHQIPLMASSRITDEQLYQERIQKAKRDSDEVSQSMIHDVQELLRRFGIPFITAPMEAEAQCAELFRLKMVDGIITDDSDCFLFGGSRIYRNMFNQKRYVECYFSEEVDQKIGLDREKLIELAILLGSDYTEGIKGVGPVLAMEILAEFGSLKSFKKWFDENARGLKASEESDTSLKKNLRSRIKSGKLFLPDNFPDPIVFHAYTHPEVDRDESEFKWGVPNLDQIRSYLMYNVGWTQTRVDEVMLPLIRDMNKKRAEGTQSTIGEFFSQEYISYKKGIAQGKRMKLATERLHQHKK